MVVTPGDHAPGKTPNANEPKNTSTKSLRMSMVRKAGEASSMCFFKEVKRTMAIALYNTHSPFRRETSTVSARNLDCHRTDCREQSNNTANVEQPENRQEKETTSNGAANIPQTRVSRKGIAPLPKGSLDPPHGNVWIAQRKSHTYSRKGALTTARPPLVNVCLTGGDMCEELRGYLLYRLGLAGGISTSIDKVQPK